MTDDEANRFIGEFEASMGKDLKKGAKAAYFRWSIGVDFDAALKTLRYMEEQAGPKGFTQYTKPNLSMLRNTYDYLKSARTADQTHVFIDNYPDCGYCGKSGLVFVVKAGPTWGTAKIRARESTIKWDVMGILLVPCSCLAGDAMSGFHGLSPKSRKWITDNAAFKLQYDAETYKRACYGLPPVKRDGDLKMVATPSAAFVGDTGSKRSREKERPEEADTWV